MFSEEDQDILVASDLSADFVAGVSRTFSEEDQGILVG